MCQEGHAQAGYAYFVNGDETKAQQCAIRATGGAVALGAAVATEGASTAASAAGGAIGAGAGLATRRGLEELPTTKRGAKEVCNMDKWDVAAQVAVGGVAGGAARAIAPTAAGAGRAAVTENQAQQSLLRLEAAQQNLSWGEALRYGVAEDSTKQAATQAASKPTEWALGAARPARYSKGDRVRAYYYWRLDAKRKSPNTYNGKFTYVNTNGTYDILFDDGVEQEYIPADWIVCWL